MGHRFAPKWRFHTGLCKFLRNISTNIWRSLKFEETRWPKTWRSIFFIYLLQHHDFLTFSTGWFSIYFCYSVTVKTIYNFSRHSSHIGVQNQWNGGRSTLYLLFHWNICVSAFHVSENTLLSPGQTIAISQPNISQHCWAYHVACVWPSCCDVLGHAGCYWLKFENGHIFHATFVLVWPGRFLRPCMPTRLIFNTQHVITRRNTLAKCSQHVEILRLFGRAFKWWANNVANFWPGFY